MVSVPIVVGDADRTVIGPVRDILANAVITIASRPLAAYDRNDSVMATIMPFGTVPGVTVIVSKDAATFRTWTVHPSKSSIALQTERHKDVDGDGRTVIEHHIRQAAWLLSLPALGRSDLDGLFDAAIQKIADMSALAIPSLWSTNLLVDVRVAGPYGPASANVQLDGALVEVPDDIRRETEAIPTAVRISLAGPNGPVTIGSVRGLRRYDSEALMNISIRSRRAETELRRTDVRNLEPQVQGDPE